MSADDMPDLGLVLLLLAGGEAARDFVIRLRKSHAQSHGRSHPGTLSTMRIRLIGCSYRPALSFEFAVVQSTLCSILNPAKVQLPRGVGRTASEAPVNQASDDNGKRYVSFSNAKFKKVSLSSNGRTGDTRYQVGRHQPHRSRSNSVLN